ncbi:MAG: 2-amino-4-hydroxy-6-hydroxymethyldihydropteridine diphosphokinase [candidate division Zixibacteria bacterium RBG_16_50_21]|nr:MAG: 2-amino-4-hydroxy-6-hydroxymethyldihydropteridine diphosphokinase [candidate division Zixibacteria bacterium RBG_16_50_21]
MAEVFIGFGSNLGQREKNIQKALQILSEHPQIMITRISSLFETEPVEMESKNLFLNGAVQVQTVLIPQKLAPLLENIELKMGRPKDEKGKKQDRAIDLDLLFYNDLIFSIPGLTVPHPQAHRRRFVLLPMLEIAPEFEHPYFRVPLKQMLDSLESKEKVTPCPNLTISL